MLATTICIVAFITAFVIVFSAGSIILYEKNLIGHRLTKLKKSIGLMDDEYSRPLLSRVIDPILESISERILKATPRNYVETLEKKIKSAGTPFNLTIKEWTFIQIVCIAGLPIVTILLGISIEAAVSNVVLMMLLEISLGLIVPIALLNPKIKERQKLILNALPEVLDLLTVSVEAGLSFDGAITKVIDKMAGPLVDEFDMALQEIKMGKHRRDALKSMAARISIQDVTTFVGSIIQAEQLGVSIGNVLRLQSAQIRERRRQKAKEKAMKAPVKMLIPMIFFIFPTIFAVLLGPVIIKMIHSFMG